MNHRAIAAFVVLAAPRVAAADTAEPVTMTYTAPAGCPSQADLESAVRTRTPLVQFVPAGHRTFAIAIEQRGDEFVGTLAVADDPASVRKLSAHRCDDLTGALALITALAIDPTAGEARATQPPQVAPKQRWEGDLDALAGVAFGVGADAMPALAIEGRLEPRPDLAFALAAIVGYDRATLDTGAARFVWMVARPSACWRPLRGPLELDVCGHVEAGAMRASGEDVVLGQSITRPWVAAGVHVEARWRLGPRFYVQLELAASAPFQRDRFLFQPATTIYETPAVTGWVGAGGGVHFR